MFAEEKGATKKKGKPKIQEYYLGMTVYHLGC